MEVAQYLYSMETYLNFLQGEVGKRIVNWVLSSGLVAIVLGAWVYSLSQKQKATDLKVDKMSDKITNLLTHDRDTLIKSLDRNSDILEKLQSKRKND